MNYLQNIAIAALLILGTTHKANAAPTKTNTKKNISKAAKHPAECSCSSCKGRSQKTHKSGCSCSQCRRH